MKIEINLPKRLSKIFCNHNHLCWTPIGKSEDRLHYCGNCGKIFEVEVYDKQ